MEVEMGHVSGESSHFAAVAGQIQGCGRSEESSTVPMIGGRIRAILVAQHVANSPPMAVWTVA